MYNTANCSAFICCGNCSFDRSNAQTEFFKEFIFRNNFAVSWDHSLSKKDFTYVNMSLNHFSCIDHIIMSKNVFTYITDNFVLSDPCNHSSHNIVYMSISVTDFYRITQIDCNQTVHIWSKATSKQIEQYQLCLNNKLRAIDQMSSAYVCTDVYCTSMEHRNEIALLCNCIIKSCAASG